MSARLAQERSVENMARCFNVTGSCNPKLHYMVDIQSKLEEIKKLVDAGAYFTINRARQYGKTTTLKALAEYLKNDYVVISLDFQRIGNEEFETASIFSVAFADYLVSTIQNGINEAHRLNDKVLEKLEMAAQGNNRFSLRKLFELLSQLCKTAEKPVVMIIDEVDSATNNQVFLDFLAQLRSDYLERDTISTFHSVILAGVYDVKNIKRKIRPDDDHKVNSPWNIATDFNVNMSFSKDGIEGMLKEYETDHNTGMDTSMMAELIYDYTSGYPFLVSRYCQLIDERVAETEKFPTKSSAWTREGFLEADKIFLSEKNTLFESLTGKLSDYPELKHMLSQILFEGSDIPYVATNPSIEMATMFGFVKNEHNVVTITNRVFETVLMNHLLSEETVGHPVFNSALTDKNRFIQGGRLNMRLVLERFVDTFTELYKDDDERFKEEIGRKYFLLFLKPIINGIGHSYVEARTRDMKRTDIIIDYRGEQFIVELKIWRGQQYHDDGEAQIAEYLDFYHLSKGYMLTFNFTQSKTIGVVERQYGDKTLVEATV